MSTPPMRGTVRAQDAGRVRVTVPDLDRGAETHPAFGHLPDAQPGDHVRVLLDQDGRLTVVAWQPAA